MKRNNTLSKNLLAYSSVASAFFCGIKNSDGQVIYHDFIPDEELAGFSQFDLNNDGVYDLAFNEAHTSHVLIYNSQNYDEVSCTASIRASSYISLAGAASGLAKLDSGDVINENLNWIPSATFLLGYFYKNDHQGIYSALGNWANTTDKFFGFRLNNNGSTYYGWMRMSVNGYGCGVTLKDYAYDTNPDELIIAGDTTVFTLVEQPLQIIKPNIFVKGQILFIRLNQSLPSSSVFSIVDLLGRERYSGFCNQQLSQVSIAGLNPGEYLFHIQEKSFTTTLRFIKD
jgi:hypothetical protein